MIQLTRLNGAHIVINALLIQQIEASPDTIIMLTTDRKLMVQETVEEVVERVVEYLRQLRGEEGSPEAIAAGRWGRIVTGGGTSGGRETQPP